MFNRHKTGYESQISFSSLKIGIIRPKEYHVSVKIRTYFSVRKITDLIILQNFAQYNVFLNIFKTENFSKQTIFYRKNSFIKNKLCNFWIFINFFFCFQQFWSCFLSQSIHVISVFINFFFKTKSILESWRNLRN